MKDKKSPSILIKLWILINLGIVSNVVVSVCSKILVIGGSGRVGGSTVRTLINKGYQVDVGGRQISNWDAYKNRFKSQPSVLYNLNHKAKFIQIDGSSESSLQRHLLNYDLIINTAGPFQGLRKNLVLESCLKNGKHYLDVCDDIELSRICRSKEYQAMAKQTGSIAIISTGIWPGGSSLLAQELIANIKNGTNPVDIDKIVFSFFTAGSGGAGETILTATFLLLGIRDVARLNLIECESCYRSSKVPGVETYFGTAPRLWNKLFILITKIIPQKVLQDRLWMKIFAMVSLPMVRLVDAFVGSRNGIRIDAYGKSDDVQVDISKSSSSFKYPLLGTSIMVHEDMEQAVGDAIAAFAIPIIANANEESAVPSFSIQSGVYFPEEVPCPDYLKHVLSVIKSTASELI